MSRYEASGKNFLEPFETKAYQKKKRKEKKTVKVTFKRLW